MVPVVVRASWGTGRYYGLWGVCRLNRFYTGISLTIVSIGPVWFVRRGVYRMSVGEGLMIRGGVIMLFFTNFFSPHKIPNAAYNVILEMLSFY